jgi:transposase InsO family protein
MAYLAEFTADFRHTPGATNVVADALSRPPAPSTGTPTQQVPASQILPHNSAAKAPVAVLPSKTQIPPPSQHRASQVIAVQDSSPPEVHPPPQAAPPSEALLPAVATAQPLDFVALAAAQLSCPEVATMRASTALSIVSKPMGDHQLLGDVSTGEFHPLLPPQFRTAVFLSLHNIAHPGVRASCRLFSSRLCWPHISKQVAALARACPHCQRSKVHKHVHLQPEHIEVPRRQFAHVHVDLVGPLPRSAGFSCLLTVLDRTTHWPEAIPLATVTPADCAAGFFQGWVQQFGLPDTITSDRGPEFASSLWSALCSLLNISHVQTTAYHPQANGAVERFHRRLKDALRARAAGADWHAHLPWVMLGIRSAWRENTAFSPAEAVFGAQPVLPGQFLSSPEPPSPSFLQELQQTLNNRPPAPAAHHNRSGPLSLPEELLLSRFDLVHRDGAQPLLSPMYDSPYLVLERSLSFLKFRWEKGKMPSLLFA